MKLTRGIIINISIDLFAERSIKNDSIEGISEKVSISKDSIDETMQNNTPTKQDCTNINSDTQSILYKLFVTFNEQNSEQSRKTNRILFSSNQYVKKIVTNMLEEVNRNREENLLQCFDILLPHAKVTPFDKCNAARILSRLFISHVLGDLCKYPFNKKVT